MADTKALPTESRDLLTPPLEELAEVLKNGLSKNFSTVEVNVVECPDLREKPWTLAAPGICGRTRIADVGGPPYLVPLPDLSKLYSFDEIAQIAEHPGGFMIGAGAGSTAFVGVICELVAINLVIRDRCPSLIMAAERAIRELDVAFRENGFQGSPFGLVRLVRNFTKQQHESDEQARRRFFRRVFGILWFGNKIGKGQFRGKAVPTYVYPDCLKAAIRERLSGHLRDYPNPESPAVYIVTLTDLSQARWPGDP